MYLKYQKQLMAEGVATKEQVKRISDNVQAALQARIRPCGAACPPQPGG